MNHAFGAKPKNSLYNQDHKIFLLYFSLQVLQSYIKSIIYS